MTANPAVRDLIRRGSLGTTVRTGPVIIAGSRDLIVTHAQITAGFDRLLDEHDIVCSEVVSGNARGIDRCGEAWAASCGLPVKPFPVTRNEWRRIGPSAGPLRNGRMADYGIALVAFWDGKSTGTVDMINQMLKRKKPFSVVRVDLPAHIVKQRQSAARWGDDRRVREREGK